jgi:integrase
MPRLVHKLPKYRRHKGSGQAIVSLCGREVYLGPWKSKRSRLEYQRLLAEFVAADRTPPAAPADEITVLELCAAYWKHAKRFYIKPDGAETSEQQGIRDALRIVKQRYGHTRAVDFGPLALQACREEMIGLGWCRNTVNRRCEKIKRAFKWCASQELIPGAIYHALTTVDGLKQGRSKARETGDVQPVPEEVFQQTLAHVPPPICDMLRLVRLTGMRPGEVCQLRPCDLDRSGEVWAFRPATHKTAWRGRKRIIAIGPKGQAILTPYLLRPAEAYCFAPEEVERKRQRGRRSEETPSKARRRWRRSFNPCYAVKSLWSAVKRATEKAGVEMWGPNRLRHSAATEIRAKFGLEAAQTVLGHARADVTQIYAERDGTLAASVMKEIG